MIVSIAGTVLGLTNRKSMRVSEFLPMYDVVIAVSATLTAFDEGVLA